MFKKTLILGAGVVALFGAMLATAASPTVEVTEEDVDDSWFLADTRSPGSGAFEEGPETPPLGSGSFMMSTPDGSAKVQLLTNAYEGVALADIDGIGYSTYRSEAPDGSPALAGLNLRVDLKGNGDPDVYMVYEPYQDQGNAAISDNVWQNWDAYRNGDAKWWINTGAAGCGQGSPCTWDFIVSEFPNATIEEADDFSGSLGVNQGSGNSGIVTNVDALYVSVEGDMTKYDFDPMVKDQCKKGGWMSFDFPEPFMNQGDCIQFVNTGK